MTAGLATPVVGGRGASSAPASVTNARAPINRGSTQTTINLLSIRVMTQADRCAVGIREAKTSCTLRGFVEQSIRESLRIRNESSGNFANRSSIFGNRQERGCQQLTSLHGIRRA